MSARDAETGASFRISASPAAARRASARARPCSPPFLASWAASAAHSGEEDGTGLVARVKSSRASRDQTADRCGFGDSARFIPPCVAALRTAAGAICPKTFLSTPVTDTSSPGCPPESLLSTTTRARRPSAQSKTNSRPGTGISPASPAAPVGMPSSTT